MMEQAKMENIDIEKNKELFEYEMTEVILQLKGEFAVISGKDMGGTDAAFDDERLRIAPISLRKVVVDQIKANVPQQANCEIQEMAPVRVTLPALDLPETKVVPAREIAPSEGSLPKSIGLPKMPPRFSKWEMNAASDAVAAKIQFSPSAFKALDEGKVVLSIPSLPAVSVDSRKYPSAWREIPQFQSPASLSLDAAPKRIEIPAAGLERDINIQQWRPVSLSPTLPAIDIDARYIPPMAIKQVTLNQHAVHLPKAEMRLQVSDSRTEKRESLASREIFVPAIAPISLKAPKGDIQAMKAMGNEKIHIDLPQIPHKTAFVLQRPEPVPARIQVSPTALKALDERKERGKVVLSIPSLPAVSVDSGKYASAWREVPQFRIPASLSLDAVPKRIEIPAADLERDINIRQWQIVSLSPALPEIDVNVRYIPPRAIKQVSLSRKTVRLPETETNVSMPNSCSARQISRVSRQISAPTISPINIKEMARSERIDKTPIPVVNTDLPEDLAAMEDYFKHIDIRGTYGK